MNPSLWMEWAPLLWKGLVTTVQVALLSGVVALFLAVLTGICRLSKYKLIRGIAYVYVMLFRGVSLLVLLFWVYFSLPALGIEFSAISAAVLAFGLNYGAFGSEIVRSSILAVPKGQWEAALALNLTPAQRMFRIILPQAVVRMLPPINNLMIELLKATSLVSFITLADLTFQSQILRGQFFGNTIELFTIVLILYFILSSCITLVARLLERKLSAGRM
ncbi:ectoine/hydroxyectoine ABC transporter permease subunit EhuC [Paenibacillus sp. IB182496]|uniref:Ectoine/hydroxyectoine ABC transporter permease subunit EhuC n=1 Tax=Paenibacillus sabuli TaxID=2772509 RepID=A0A927GRV6_9BACL|nr:ectoine/hydroxyectoine ABC transporter permease subunit EhuC [Paenibacillus sabuli]MBD2845656.1 ectoine/hydroxyectoine ABC transporter permease subunit EhuC [Paenibacillus sabuli]